MIFQDNLKFSQQVTCLCVKISKISGILYSIRDVLSLSTLKILYYSFVYSQLNLHILSWGGANANILQPLHVSLNNLVRNVGFSLNVASATILYKRLSILTFNELYKLKLLQFMHKTMNNKPVLCVNFLEDVRWSHLYDTRQSSLRLPASRVNINKEFPIVNSIKLWCKLPPSIKNIESVQTFKKSVIELIKQNII